MQTLPFTSRSSLADTGWRLQQMTENDELGPHYRLRFTPDQAKKLRQAFQSDDLKGYRVAIMHSVCALRYAAMFEPQNVIWQHGWYDSRQNGCYALMCVILAMQRIDEADVMAIENFYRMIPSLSEPSAVEAIGAVRRLCNGYLDPMGLCILKVTEHLPLLRALGRHGLPKPLAPRLARYAAEFPNLHEFHLFGRPE